MGHRKKKESDLVLSPVTIFVSTPLLTTRSRPAASSASSIDVSDDPFKLYKFTFGIEICAAPIPGISRKKGAIGGKDFIGEGPQEFCNLHQDMEDLVVKFFP